MGNYLNCFQNKNEEVRSDLDKPSDSNSNVKLYETIDGIKNENINSTIPTSITDDELQILENSDFSTSYQTKTVEIEPEKKISSKSFNEEQAFGNFNSNYDAPEIISKCYSPLETNHSYQSDDIESLMSKVSELTSNDEESSFSCDYSIFSPSFSHTRPQNEDNKLATFNELNIDDNR